jgi:tetraacyldisaccharide 4'-kinase
LPIGWLYGKIADVRNWLYDRGTFRSHDLGARTISIGNVTAGGTGKTPLVALVAQILADSGERVCILTRGYGRENAQRRVLVSDGSNVLVDARAGGDEPVELAHKLLTRSVVVVADADRVSAAAWAKEKFGITAFVLDDGFQHRRAKRDLDIVCIDATNPFGDGAMLPGGMLREPLDNLRRADAFVITRMNLVESVEALLVQLRDENPDASVFGANFEVEEFTKLADFYRGRSTRGDDYDRQFIANSFAFCGLGNPESFLSQLARQHFAVTGLLPFADHHRYRQSDIELIEAEARSRNSRGLITTVKDAVKLQDFKFSLPCFVAELSVEINDHDRLRDLVLSA